MPTPDKMGGVNGSFTIDGFGGDWNGFDLECAQSVEDATGYDEAEDSYNAGSGVRDWTLDATGFAKRSAKFGIGSLTNAAVAVVGTVDTGCTYTGNFVVASGKISAKKMAATVPISVRAKNQGTVAEAWASGTGSG